MPRAAGNLRITLCGKVILLLTGPCLNTQLRQNNFRGDTRGKIANREIYCFIFSMDHINRMHFNQLRDQSLCPTES